MGWFSDIGSYLTSGLLGTNSSALSAGLSYKYTKKLQDSQNEFTERMSNTAHQREVADLRSAGLNPILSATGGNGATTPSAGSGSITAPDIDLVGASNSSKQVKNETDLKKSQVSLNKTQEDVNKSTERMNQYQSDLAHENSAYVNEQNRQLMEFGPRLQEAQIANVQANTAKAVQDRIDSIGVTGAQIDNLRNSAYGVSLENAERKRNEEFIHSQSKFGRNVYNWSKGLGISPSLRLR